MLKDNLGRLRLLGILEGISFLVLMGVCMPLKYIWKIPEPTYPVGMAHGLLFVAYCMWAIFVGIDRKWSFGKIFLALLAALLPFGTFVADAKIFKPEMGKSKG